MATYNISTYVHLQAMESHLSDDCVLLNDIDCSDSKEAHPIAGEPGTYNGFDPIGQNGTEFEGTFDGGGFTLSNLYVNWDDRFCGLFGEVTRVGATNGGFIKDLTIKSADINCTAGANIAGILAGKITGKDTGDRCDIDDVSVSGSVTTMSADAPSCGGMVGTSVYTDWTDCSSGTTIVSTYNTGGFIFTATDCIFLRCVSSGSISTISTLANVGIGGFVSKTTDSPVFTSCSSSVALTYTNTTSEDPTIGIGGFAGNPIGGTFTYCYAAGAIVVVVEGTVIIGGFCGARSSGTFTECGANVDIICQEIAGSNFLVSGIGGFIGSGTSTTDCYARGDICKSGVKNNHTAQDLRIGGFAGSISGCASCYSTGLIGIDTTGSGSAVVRGGFAGENSGTITLCHWDTDTSGMTAGAGTGGETGLTGNTTEEMKTESTFTDDSWDFAATWDIPTYTQPAVSQSNLTVWPSASGDYENFDEGTKDADAFVVVIPSTNGIRWIDSLDALLVGTASDEWKVGSNRLETPLSPTNFGVKRQSTYGSAWIHPATVNEVLLFVDFVGRKVREMTWGADVEKYVAPDMTSLAEHITETGIVNIAHQKNPDSMLWCVLTDGSLISLVYDREQNVIAWSDHPTDGLVQSVCVVPGTSEDEVWISVTRTNGVFIEKMASRIQGAIEDSFFVDSGITYDSTATSTITGLSHLKSETVSVLADGVVFDDAVVDASGEITLKLAGVTTTASVVQVGLPYTALLQPMRIVQNSQVGSSLGSITRVNGLKINFLNTKGAYYGADEDSLLAIDFDDVTFDASEYISGLFSGDVPVTMQGGFSVQNPIIISSSQPLPMTVKAIVASVDVTGR